jgi:hypothetical protein
MTRISFKSISLGLLALSTALFAGCMGSEAQGPSSEYGTLSIKVGTGVVNGSAKSGLSKASVISLSKLVITLTSNATSPDTIRDTITVGENNFVASSTVTQNIDSAYVLKALRTWKIEAKTLDENDSVIHIKTDSIVRLLAGQVRSLNLTLSPRFVMYKANFIFPDSLATSATSIKQKMNITRLLMLVDGDTVVDSSATFLSSTSYSIDYNYVAVNTPTTVALVVIGNLTGWSFASDSVLYRLDSIAVSGLLPTGDGSQDVTLPYTGPVTGTDSLKIQIQKVGLYQVTATTEPIVVPKRSSK